MIYDVVITLQIIQVVFNANLVLINTLHRILHDIIFNDFFHFITHL